MDRTDASPFSTQGGEQPAQPKKEWNRIDELRPYPKNSKCDFVVDIKPDLTVTYASPNYLKFFKLQKNQYVGKSCLVDIPERFHGLLKRIFSEIVKTKNPRININPSLRDDKEYLLKWINVPILDENQNVIEIHCAGHFIKERRHTPR